MTFKKNLATVYCFR